MLEALGGINMFKELYYWDCGCGSYWEGNISLPHAVHIPDIEERMMLGKILDEDGFQCAVSENEHPVMLVN